MKFFKNIATHFARMKTSILVGRKAEKFEKLLDTMDIDYFWEPVELTPNIYFRSVTYNHGTFIYLNPEGTKEYGYKSIVLWNSTTTYGVSNVNYEKLVNDTLDKGIGRFTKEHAAKTIENEIQKAVIEANRGLL